MGGILETGAVVITEKRSRNNNNNKKKKKKAARNVDCMQMCYREAGFTDRERKSPLALQRQAYCTDRNGVCEPGDVATVQQK